MTIENVRVIGQICAAIAWPFGIGVLGGTVMHLAFWALGC